MSAAVRRVHTALKVCRSSQISLFPLPPQFSSIEFPHYITVRSVTLKPQFTHPSRVYSDFSTEDKELSFMNQNFEFLDQFSPFGHLCSSSSAVIYPNERLRLVIGLSKIIKQAEGSLLKGFCIRFCPYKLVDILKLFEDRQASFAFFKLVFADVSEYMVQSCCISGHLLLSEGLRLIAQDMLYWVVSRVGEGRSDEVLEYMWRDHYKYGSDFFVLDALMRAFVNADMRSPALKILDKIRELGLLPSLSAMCILFRLLLRVGDYGSVWKLLRDMLYRGPRPNNFVYNMIILGFCRKQYVNVGESLLCVMSKYGCEPDVVGYNILINAYCLRSWISHALLWVEYMVESGCKPSTYTFATIISSLCKEGKLSEARKIFNEIPEMGIAPSTLLYNSLLDGYVKAREIGQANMLYEEMGKMGVAPDCITLNILVAGNYKFGRVEDGDRFLRELSITDLILDNSVSDMYISRLCWAGRLNEAFDLLNRMLEKGIYPSLVAFNSIISAYGREGFNEKTFEVYETMYKFGLVPPASALTSLLLSLSLMGRLQDMKYLVVKTLERAWPVNTVAFTVLLDAYFRKGDIAGAQSVWEEMERRKMTPDAVAFSAFINGLRRSSFIEEAFYWFQEMKRKGLVPNNYVYNSLIAGFCKCGDMEKALSLKEEMRQRDLLPDLFTINIIINGFCKQGRMKLAIDTYMAMPRYEIIPDIVTYNTLISGHCKVFDMINVDNIVNKMCASGWEPDLTTYNICMHGLCSSRRLNQAVLILNEIVSVGIAPNTVTYNTLMNGICNDILDRALILTGKLLKMGFVPNIVTINLLLSHLRKKGSPQRTCMWYQKLSEIQYEFDEISYKIWERACDDINSNAPKRRITGKVLFLDFLMYVTYDYISRSRRCSQKCDQSFELVDWKNSMAILS